MSDYEKEHLDAKQKVKEFNKELSQNNGAASVSKESLIDQFVKDETMKTELKNDLTMKEKAEMVRQNQERIQEIEKYVRKRRIAQSDPEQQNNDEYVTEDTDE